MKKKALIIGHTGQDGYYLTRLLIERDYEIIGLSSHDVFSNTVYKPENGSISDALYTTGIIQDWQPDELYYLAALHQSSIDQSIDDLSFYKATIDVNAIGLLNLLGSIERHHPSCKVFYAASSHVFGGTDLQEQDENTPFSPVSIYGISKVLGMQFCDLYRQKGVFCSVGIFYNHESPRRQSKFVSKKIVETAVSISLGLTNELVLGDLNAKIDWGYAPDYMQAANLMLTSGKPENYIVSSGSLHTVGDFVHLVFNELGLKSEMYVKENRSIILKKSVTTLQGNNHKLKNDTGWNPTVTFNEMVKLLVKAELDIRKNLQA